MRETYQTVTWRSTSIAEWRRQNVDAVENIIKSMPHVGLKRLKVYSRRWLLWLQRFIHNIFEAHFNAMMLHVAPSGFMPEKIRKVLLILKYL